jgi:hypothetical protein
VAQLAARLDGIEEVGGSNPPGSTNPLERFVRTFCLFVYIDVDNFVGAESARIVIFMHHFICFAAVQ